MGRPQATGLLGLVRKKKERLLRNLRGGARDWLSWYRARVYGSKACGDVRGKHTAGWGMNVPHVEECLAVIVRYFLSILEFGRKRYAGVS